MVVAILVLMSVVLPAINTATPYHDKVRSGDVMGLASGVRFTPTEGWGITEGVRVGKAPASGYPASAAVTDQTLTFSVRVDNYTGATAKLPTSAQLLEKIRQTTAKFNQGLHVTGKAFAATTATGLTGVVARYNGSNSDGILAAFVSGKVGIAVTAVAGSGAFNEDLVKNVAGMIDSLEITKAAAK